MQVLRPMEQSTSLFCFNLKSTFRMESWNANLVPFSTQVVVYQSIKLSGKHVMSGCSNVWPIEIPTKNHTFGINVGKNTVRLSIW